MLKVALVYDVDGWCFHHIASQICRYSPDWECDMLRYPEIQDGQLEPYDVVIQCGYHGIRHVVCGNPRALVSSVADQIYWKHKHGSKRIPECRKVGLVTALHRRMLAELQAAYPDLTFWGTTEDGVDTHLFRPGPQQDNETPVIGWCGNSANDLKRVPNIATACKRLGLPMSTKDRAENTMIPHLEMPAWYRTLDLYVCASDSEGTPNPVLEAASCGIPVLTTNVGIVPDIAPRSVGGIVVMPDSSPETIEEHIRLLTRDRLQLRERGRRARVAIERGKWDWKYRVRQYQRAAEAAIQEAACRQ